MTVPRSFWPSWGRGGRGRRRVRGLGGFVVGGLGGFVGLFGRREVVELYSMPGSNRRPWAHKTHALGPTELMELVHTAAYDDRFLLRVRRNFFHGNTIADSELPRLKTVMLMCVCLQIIHFNACVPVTYLPFVT